MVCHNKLWSTAINRVLEFRFRAPILCSPACCKRLQQLLLKSCELQLLAGLILQQLGLAGLQLRLLVLYGKTQQLACKHKHHIGINHLVLSQHGPIQQFA